MKKLLFFLSIAMLAVGCAQQQNTECNDCELRFHENGEFRILQFTDTHWNRNNDSGENPEEIQRIIKETVAKENPDFIIYTGDVVLGGNDIMQEWQIFADFMASLSVPYSIVPGNHDPESADMQEVFDFLVEQPYFMGEVSVENVRGYGNTVLPVKASDGSDKTQALIYCFDSNDYSPSNEDYGYYGYFEPEQIAWYKQQSRSYAEANGGNPVPAVAFFHIPLPEYYDIPAEDMHGTLNEPICSPKVNTGMYMAMREMGDVMGTFVGHDHTNDFIGKFYTIALAYGRRTQDTDYEKELVPSGGRVIVLKEGKHQFETYCSAPERTDFTFYYPSGITSKEKAEFSYAPALNVNPSQNGISYTYSEGDFLSTSDIYKIGKNVQKGTMANFDITKAPAKDHFAYVFEGYVDIPETDVYLFYLNSDDGARLYIDGKEIIDNDGSHSSDRKGGKVGLEKGFHEIKVEFFDDYAEEELMVRMLSTNYPLAKLSDQMLYVK